MWCTRTYICTQIRTLESPYLSLQIMLLFLFKICKVWLQVLQSLYCTLQKIFCSHIVVWNVKQSCLITEYACEIRYFFLHWQIGNKKHFENQKILAILSKSTVSFCFVNFFNILKLIPQEKFIVCGTQHWFGLD